jgi:hypothetical protein
MPYLSALYKRPASFRAVAVTALALPTREASRREKAPRAVRVRPTWTADKRKILAARFAERRVLALRTCPPEILLPGANVSQDVQCLAVGQRRMSRPHSPTSLRAVDGLNPCPWLRSVPRTRNHASRTWNVGSLAWRVLSRAAGSASIAIPSSCSDARVASISWSQASRFAW